MNVISLSLRSKIVSTWNTSIIWSTAFAFCILQSLFCLHSSFIVNFDWIPIAYFFSYQFFLFVYFNAIEFNIYNSINAPSMLNAQWHNQNIILDGKPYSTSNLCIFKGFLICSARVKKGIDNISEGLFN